MSRNVDLELEKMVIREGEFRRDGGRIFFAEFG